MNYKYIEKLSKEELINLNKIIIERLKEIERTDVLKKSLSFKKADIVSFHHNEIKNTGVILRINQKTISVCLTNGTQCNISPSFLNHEKRPSKKACELRKKLFPTFEEMIEDLAEICPSVRKKLNYKK